MRTFLVVLCIVIIVVFFFFQAAFALIGIAIGLAKLLTAIAAGYLLIAYLRHRYKKRTA